MACVANHAISETVRSVLTYLLQIRFVRCRESGDLAGMRDAAAKELENTKRLYELVREDSRIGFESSNHYYYTLNDLLEKIVNCESFL